MKLTESELWRVLNEKDLQPILQKESGLTYVIMKLGIGHEVAIFFVILEGGILLQTLAYLPFEIDEKAVGEIGRLLHAINLDVDMPGFCMDEKKKLIFYRLVMPALENEISERVIEVMLGSTKIACETFVEAIRMVATKGYSLDQVRKKKNP